MPARTGGVTLPVHFNVSIALVVFMGLASGGMLALSLMAGRKQQMSFSIMLVLAGLLALLGALGSLTLVDNLATGIANAGVLLVLSFTLGYALTTYSVLTPRAARWKINPSAGRSGRMAVICLAPGEPPEYEARSAARRLELADDAEDVPPLLLRPFYMRDLRVKYEAIGRSPCKGYHVELAEQVQARLDSSRYVVYPAFYSDHPTLPEAIVQSIQEGVKRVIVVHVRLTDPPDPVKAGELLQGLDPERYGVRLIEQGPLFDSDLLPQIYVRRVLEAVPQVGQPAQDVGLLLVGRGHHATGGTSAIRYRQELEFHERVRQALVRVGFDEQRVVIGWLRRAPTAAQALQSLVDRGSRVVFWMPATYPADGIITLYDIPAQIERVATARGVKLIALGAWNADELAAEDIAGRVRSAMRPAVGVPPVPGAGAAGGNRQHAGRG